MLTNAFFSFIIDTDKWKKGFSLFVISYYCSIKKDITTFLLYWYMGFVYFLNQRQNFFLLCKSNKCSSVKLCQSIVKWCKANKCSRPLRGATHPGVSEGAGAALFPDRGLTFPRRCDIILLGEHQQKNVCSPLPPQPPRSFIIP